MTSALKSLLEAVMMGWRRLVRSSVVRVGFVVVAGFVVSVALRGGSAATAGPDPPPSIVSFVADASEITVPGYTFVRATADRNPGNTGYSIHIVDDDAPGSSWACGRRLSVG